MSEQAGDEERHRIDSRVAEYDISRNCFALVGTSDNWFSSIAAWLKT